MPNKTLTEQFKVLKFFRIKDNSTWGTKNKIYHFYIENKKTGKTLYWARLPHDWTIKVMKEFLESVDFDFNSLPRSVE